MDQQAFTSRYWGRRISRRGVIRSATFGVAGLAGAALIGCGGDDSNLGESPRVGGTATAGATGEPVRGGTLRVATVADTNTLDPAFSTSTPDAAITMASHDNLVLQQHDASIRGMLAERLEPNEDLTEYVAHLRPGVTFHHGKAFTAEDVRFTFERLLDPDLGSPGRAGLTSIDRVEVVDDLTVKFVLKAPDAFLPDALSIYQARIVPSDIEPSRFATEAFGTGPFKIAEHRPGERTQFTRNEAYWDNPLPYLDAVTFFYMPEPVTRLEALRTGSVDVQMPLEAGQIRSAESGGVIVSEQASAGYINLAMRVDREPFTDIRVRRAMQALTDREFIREAANYGRGEIANDHPVPSFDPHFWQGQVQPGFDPAEAKKLLDAAGFGAGLDVTLHTSTITPGIQELAIAFKELATQGGVNVTVQRGSEDSYWSDVWLIEPFTTVGWNGRTVDQALSLIYLSDAPWNEAKYQNSEVDDLLVRARGIADQEERTEVYGRIQQILIDDAPRIIPVFKPNFIGMSTKVGGVAAHPSNWLLLHRAWLQQ